MLSSVGVLFFSTRAQAKNTFELFGEKSNVAIAEKLGDFGDFESGLAEEEVGPVNAFFHEPPFG